ncbi:hypothetical protein [Fluviicola taffensis]|uniref:hypothetical protein n=1 Tax=Fluviicola taffensis TaxID=191579 RepID=UPI003137A503
MQWIIKKDYFRTVKNRIGLLLCFLWMFLHSFDGFAQHKTRSLYIQIPVQLDFKKYDYELTVDYPGYSDIHHGCQFHFLKSGGEIVRCDMRSDYDGKFIDTLVYIRFSVKMFKYYGEYVNRMPVVFKSDSVSFTIPELPDEATIDSILKAKHKAFNKEHRGEGFTEFMTDWKSYFIYANFYQGNRPYGEILFSNARYEEVPTSLFSRYTEPGWIRGPVYGAEFNFLWRKNAFILGPKIGFQITTRYVNLGLSAVYYTDFTQGSFCLKPRIGMNPGIPWVNFSYEYAIRFGPDVFGNRINRHQFSVYFLIPLRLEEY